MQSVAVLSCWIELVGNVSSAGRQAGKQDQPSGRSARWTKIGFYLHTWGAATPRRSFATAMRAKTWASDVYLAAAGAGCDVVVRLSVLCVL